ncbi:MAG TPA: hypothetical protein PLC99_22415 [Verrucomicrobiota bacterium]|nr:hypothetical protein [Verrucomicrobiota bacterium]
MAITLGAITLPATLVWEEEFTWSPVALSTEYGLTGKLLVQVSTKLDGRPITLVGKSDGTAHTGGISLTNLKTLQTALNVAGAQWTLTLHDARTFTVIAAADPLTVEPLPVYRSFFPANPTGDRWHLIRSLKLITI